jgi:large subunit ribosomal protein L6
MSRVGNRPIKIPEKVDVKIKDKNVTVKGPLGELEFSLPLTIDAVVEDGYVVFTRQSDVRQQRALHGMARSLVSNMIQGVSEGFTKKLVIDGVGYRAQAKGNTLVMNLGFSHPIEYTVPDGITVKVEKNLISVTGIDKQQIGQIAANIRQFRPVEPYKGKGIRYEDEKVQRKVGKVGA